MVHESTQLSATLFPLSSHLEQRDRHFGREMIAHPFLAPVFGIRGRESKTPEIDRVFLTLTKQDQAAPHDRGKALGERSITIEIPHPFAVHLAPMPEVFRVVADVLIQLTSRFIGVAVGCNDSPASRFFAGTVRRQEQNCADREARAADNFFAGVFLAEPKNDGDKILPAG